MTIERMPRAQLLSAADALPFRGLEPDSLTRLDRGAFVQTGEWQEHFREARQRTLADVVHRRIDPEVGGAFSHETALALHGLPVFDGFDERVHMIAPGAHPRHGAARVVRHHCPLPPADTCRIGDLAVTTLERTVFDVVRLTSPAAAIVAMDAALHVRAAPHPGESFDAAAEERFRADIRGRIADAVGARGIRQARFVVEFADGRAESPGESLLRWRVWQTSLGDVEPQWRVELPGGRHARLDLALPHRRLWLEFDGAVKTTDPLMLAGRMPAEVLAAQDARQRAVERATGWRCVRFGWADVLSLDAFTDALRRAALTR